MPRRRPQTAAPPSWLALSIEQPKPSGDSLYLARLSEAFLRKWGRRIPRAYEEVLHAAMAGEPVPPIVLDVLKAMTVMSPLSPDKLKLQLADDGFPLPANLDFSQIDNATLEKITGKKMLVPPVDSEQPPAGRKRNPKAKAAPEST